MCKIHHYLKKKEKKKYACIRIKLYTTILFPSAVPGQDIVQTD